MVNSTQGAVDSGMAATTAKLSPLEHFKRQAEITEEKLKAWSPNQSRGKEKREMEKELRRARVASRLLEQYIPKIKDLKHKEDIKNDSESKDTVAVPSESVRSCL